MGREKQREVEGLGDQEGSYELCGVATRDVGAARRASLRVVVGFAIADVGLRGSFARERWRFHFHIVDVFVFALEVVLLRCRRWQSDPETTSASQNHQADNCKKPCQRYKINVKSGIYAHLWAANEVKH